MQRRAVIGADDWSSKRAVRSKQTGVAGAEEQRVSLEAGHNALARHYIQVQLQHMLPLIYGMPCHSMLQACWCSSCPSSSSTSLSFSLRHTFSCSRSRAAVVGSISSYVFCTWLISLWRRFMLRVSLRGGFACVVVYKEKKDGGKKG